MSRADSGQRRRLIDAMTVTAARYGYGGASIARVIKEAGVSRATFYEHFADKEDCFRATYAEIAEGLRRDLTGDLAKASEREVLQHLLAAAAARPAAAQVVLLEALAAPAAVRAEHERLLDQVEEVLQGHLDHASPPLAIPARALLGGIGGAVTLRVFRNEVDGLEALLDDLIAWVRSHAMPEGSLPIGPEEWIGLGADLAGAQEDSLGEGVLSRRLPRGRGAVSPSVGNSERRQRILAAVARLSREKGFAAMTVADVVATAGVAREAFYEQFRSKEDAFLAVQAFGLEQSVGSTAGRFFGEEAWRDRVWNGLEATLGYIAGQRDLVYVDLVESYAAGPAALRRSFENRMAYTIFLEDGYRQRPEAEALPRLCSEAISGAIHELFPQARRRREVGADARARTPSGIRQPGTVPRARGCADADRG